MKASMKRIIILFLVCGLICVGSLKAQAASLSQKEMDEVTRIEWLKALTETFEMTVEEDNYPDNYYSDMDSSSENYYEVMLATEFGLVDVEAGDPLRPDEPATREFVAHTINLCMGYQLEDDTYTFSEATSVTYPQDIQIAIDKGWLELVDGNFLPEQGITSAEKTKMIDAAKEAVESTKLDTNHKDAYKLAEGVVAIPSGTEVELTDENEWTIYDCDVKLKAGDIFAIVADGLPMAKKVVSVQTKDGNIIVHVDNVEIEEAFESIDVQGTIAADLTKTQTLEDDVTLTYVVGGTEERNYEDGIALNSLKEVEEQEKEVTAVIASKTIEIPNDEISSFGIEADPGKEGITFNCKITNVSIDYNVSLLDLTAYLKVNSKVTFSCDIEGIDKEIPYFENPFVKVPIGVVGFFEPVAEGRIKGSISLALSANTTVGVQYDHGSIRGIFDFKKAAFTISAKAEVTLGVKAAVGVDVAFLKAELYIKGGAKGTAKITKYTDNPQRCTHFTAHLYSAAGGKVTFKVFGYKSSVTLEQTIMDEKNSPVRISVHYEDGTPVSVCSRDSKIGTGSIGIISGEKYKYYSPFYSQYVDSGINSGTGADGEPYTIFEYTLDDNDQATITKYNGNVAVLNIPETIDGYRVVGIGNNVFENNQRLMIVKIPDSVTTIQRYAFSNCSNLIQVKLSKSLIEMGTASFSKCNSLAEIEIPKSLDKVSVYGFSTEGAFVKCDNLKTVKFEEGTTQIATNLFYGCTGLEEIIIPDTVTVIEANAFHDCSNLKTVDIPTSVTEIEEYAFKGCKELTEIIIPDSVTQIKWCAFESCGNLATVKLSKSLTEMWNSTFARCNSLTEIEIPKSLDKVSTYGFSTEGAFANCDNLENVRFEEGTTQIAANLFHDCTGLKQIVVPDTVTVIETNAFQGCSNLYNITIPQTVTEIGDNAFEGCSKLAEIEIPQKVTTIGNNAFKNCTELKEIEIPNSVTGMGNYVFMNCTALANVKLPNIRKNITEGMFKNCTALKSITLPDSVTRIAGSAFYNSGLETITLSSKLQIIEGSAFRKCTALQSIIIQDSVTSIGSYCFAECEALSSIQLGNGLTKIEQYTFNQCPALQKVTLPYRLTSVAANAFTNCTQLTEVVIPRATTSIANNVFSYPTKMTVYGVAGTYAETWASSVGAKFVNQEKTAEDVQLNESAVVVNKGETYALVVTVTPKDFTDTISWKSSNTSVATVSETGVITAKGIGTATIRVAVGNVSASCKVTVVQPVTNIYLNKTSVSMEAENTEQLTASVYPSTANDKTVTWSSTDELVAAVDQTGKVTALKKGSTVITAMANDGSGISQSCNVTVTSTLFHCTTVDQLESMHNYENNCKDIWEHTLPGVNRMAVTFDSQTYMEDEFDYLYLYDGNGTEIGKYTGDALAGKTIIINGDTIKLKMDSDDSGNAWGFKVTKVEEYCEHTYETTWSSDETYHWHAAVCGHEPADKEEHISGEWIVDEAPTEEVGGSKHRECTVCGRILETQEIDQLINPSKELLRRLETAVNESMDVSSNLTSENYGQASEDERRQAVYDVLQQINENCQKQNIEQLGLVSAEDAVPLVQQLANIETRISELLSTSVTVIAKNEQTEYSLPQVSNALLSVPAGENATILVDYEKNIAIADADMTGALTVDMKLVSEENEELKLKVPVVVSMSIPENLDPEQPIVVYHYNDDSTEYDEVISTQVDSGNGIITFVTGSFNTFIVANKAKGVNLSGKILSFGEENEPIKIELLNMAGEVIGETEVYGNAAAYNLESIQPGTYQVRVSKKNHVTRLYEIIADEQNLELDMQILLLGDVTGDGKINVKDKRAIFKQLQGNGQLSDYLLSVGDVNGDGVINVKDKRLFYKHIAGTVSIWK